MTEKYKEPVVECPYFPDHRVKESNLLRHVEKCSLDPRAPNLKICKFNRAHRVKLIDLDTHESNCPNRNATASPVESESNPKEETVDHFLIPGLKKLSVDDALSKYGRDRIVEPVVYQRWTKGERKEFERRRKLLPSSTPSGDKEEASSFSKVYDGPTVATDLDKGLAPTLFDAIRVKNQPQEIINWTTGEVIKPKKVDYNEEFPAL